MTKLTRPATIALPETARTWPLTACCQAMPTPGDQRQHGQRQRARVPDPVADRQQHRADGQHRAGQPGRGHRLRPGRARAGPVHQQAARRLAGDQRDDEDRHAQRRHGQALGGDQEAAAHAADALPRADACPSRRAARRWPSPARPAGSSGTSTASTSRPEPNEMVGGADRVVQAYGELAVDPRLHRQRDPASTASPTPPARRPADTAGGRRVEVWVTRAPSAGARRSRPPSRAPASPAGGTSR